MSSSDDEAVKPTVDDSKSLYSTGKQGILTSAVKPEEKDIHSKTNQPTMSDLPSNDLLDPRQTCDRSSPPRRYDSGLPTTDERHLLQIGVRSVGYGVEASGRRLGSSGDESNMLSSDDEFEETSYRESSDDEFDETPYREKLIERIVHFREVAEEAMDIMDRLCELPDGRKTRRYLKLYKLFLECEENELICWTILRELDLNKDSSELYYDQTVFGDTGLVRECDEYSDIFEEEEDGEGYSLDALLFEIQQIEADAAREQQMQQSYDQQQLEVLKQLLQLYPRDSDVKYDQLWLAQQEKNQQLWLLLKQEQEEAANSRQLYNSKQNQLSSGSRVEPIKNETLADVDAVSATLLLSQNVDASCDTSLIGVRNFTSDHSDIVVVDDECNIDKRFTTPVEDAKVKIQELQILQSEFIEPCDFVNARRDTGKDESVDSTEQGDNDVSEEFDNGSEDDDEDNLLYLLDGLADRKVEMIRESYQVAREHNAASAERNKQYHDVGVCPKVYKPGLWVYYDTSRRYEGRSPKLKEMYTGPFMVIKEVGPVNVVIQQSRRSKPFVVHVDKLKPCLAETPPSWLTDDNTMSLEKNPDDGPDPVEFAELLGLVDAEVTEPVPGVVEDAVQRTDPEDLDEKMSSRPRRIVRRPRHLADFV